ncbi:ketose-bisphosphate aldolase [Dipodascopsis tothii]|uniref:ketose-bisphosphate aldolase n=1 Tax=Dipodascopsis tothii TaxID=44089 RepID=UPI0034CE8CA0
MSTYPENNLAWQVLDHASKNGYAVGAFNCYTLECILGAIRAAEEKKSPCMIQVFPWSMHFHGREFIEYVSKACHSASVPIAFCLDHCIQESDVELALTMPFDCIMVDASSKDPEENIKYCKKIVDIARTRGITIEAEMGRIIGSEDGVPMVDMEQLFTEPDLANDFLKRTGCQYLAPSFGNIHGPYPEGGPEKYWQLDRLAEIRKAIPSNVQMVLHGMYPVLPDLLKKTIEAGTLKLNVNNSIRIPWQDFMAEKGSRLEMTAMAEQSVEIFKNGVGDFMDFLGSSGQSWK